MPLDNPFSWRWPAVLQYPSQHYNTYVPELIGPHVRFTCFSSILICSFSSATLLSAMANSSTVFCPDLWQKEHSSLSIHETQLSKLKAKLYGTILEQQSVATSLRKNLCCKSSRVIACVQTSPLPQKKIPGYSCNTTVTKTEQSNDYIPLAITISYRAKTTNLVNPHVWRRLGVIDVPEDTIIF